MIVSCGGYPNDIDFRAAYATLQRAVQIARLDGVIIFVAECRDGLGNFLMQPLDSNSPHDISNSRPRWQQNAIETLALSAIHQKTREQRIIFITDVPSALAEKMGFLPAHSLSAALALAEKMLAPSKPRLAGEIVSAILISNGTFSVPHLI